MEGWCPRDDCPDLRGEKSLARRFPGGAARALILDDRLDVWTRGVDQTARVLVVPPYKFFEHHFRDSIQKGRRRAAESFSKGALRGPRGLLPF